MDMKKITGLPTKPIKEDEMAYLKYLKADSVPQALPSNASDTMKSKTVSLDNRASRPTLLPPKTLSKNLDHIHFTFFRSHLSYLEAPPSGDDLQTYNDEMYMHGVSTKAGAESDEYVDISF